ncbi:MAG: preprotein translocase subunit SecY [Bacteroidales bacterium]|nr:preprotein translocase subunit SecY [Bacteroidales bacterium]
MNKVIETIKNIWRVEDLRSRILLTLLLVAIYRFGSNVTLPGIDPSQLGGLQAQTSEGLMSLLNAFSGGAFENASVFALGIMPYISASIVIQILAVAVPYFQKMQREGESGRRKIDQYTRWLTLAILIFQAPAFMGNLHAQSPTAFIVGDGLGFMIISTIILAAGSMFILWLGERITERGIGNGVSILIMIGIIARLPQALVQEFTSVFSTPGAGGAIMLIVELVVFVLVLAGAIVLVKAVRQVPVQYAKRIEGSRQTGGARQYIPLKMFAANVMPIIFAQAVMFLPLALTRYGEGGSSFMQSLTNPQGWVYNIVFVVLIIAFTYFYTAITMNPVQMAEDMKRNNGFIPGIKPGTPTADYLDGVMSRITLPGSICIAIIAVLPAVAANLLGVSTEFSYFFGGTSLLILVGVVLDTLQQIESHLLVRHYDGLLNAGHTRATR